MSPIGSGLSSQLGISKENSYGTRIVPDRFTEFSAETLKLDKNYVNSTGLRAGKMFSRSSRRAATTRDASGEVRFEVPTKGFTRWLRLLTDDAAAPVQQGATSAYLTTFEIGTSDPRKSATIQVGRPDSDGTVHPFDYLGCVATNYQLSAEVNGLLLAEFGINAQDEVTDQSLAVATYPIGLESYNFTQGTIEIDGAPVANIQSFSLQGGPQKKVDRYFFGGDGKKLIPIANDYSTAEATLSAEFTGLDDYTRFTDGTIAEVILEFTGSEIVAPYDDKLTITLSAAGFNGETPNVDGPDVLNQEIPVQAFDNGTDAPVKIEVISTDSTL